MARASSLDAQRELFRASLYARLLVFIALCAVSMPLTFLLADDYPWSTILLHAGHLGISRALVNPGIW